MVKLAFVQNCYSEDLSSRFSLTQANGFRARLQVTKGAAQAEISHKALLQVG